MLSKEEFQAHIDSGFNIIPVVEDLHIENQTQLCLASIVIVCSVLSRTSK